MNYKRKSRRRLFLLIRSRTPPISSEFRGVWTPQTPPLGMPLTLITHLHPVSRLRTSGAVPLQSPYYFIALHRENLLLHQSISFCILIKDGAMLLPANSTSVRGYAADRHCSSYSGVWTTQRVRTALSSNFLTDVSGQSINRIFRGFLWILDLLRWDR